jgi:hypothetical protein
MARIWLRRFKNTKIEIWKYFVDWWEPCWQRKFNFEEEKSKIRCLWTQLNFIEGLIEFMEGLIARNIDFKSIWALIGRN